MDLRTHVFFVELVVEGHQRSSQRPGIGPPGSSWLLLDFPGSSWLLLAAPGVPLQDSQVPASTHTLLFQDATEEPGGARRSHEKPVDELL